ncbi:NYN domain-containing protein [Stenotrophomonas maltophilia]|uniref:NYN domain-containing protein n=1 Tax=Stenotrophomonas maltophilia TaxID=40324 RepID=UPI0013D94712|nr:NYN domain-containing protein [Stenotrophomonas maltophilia]
MAIATAAYVDGYNLYYGRIRNTHFKWIDVVRLFEILLCDQNPTSERLHIS